MHTFHNPKSRLLTPCHTRHGDSCATPLHTGLTGIRTAVRAPMRKEASEIGLRLTHAMWRGLRRPQNRSSRVGQPAAPRKPRLAFTHCIALKPIGLAALRVAVPAIGCVVVGLVAGQVKGPGGGSGGQQQVLP